MQATLIHPAAYHAIRLAMAPVNIIGAEPASDVARAVGASFGRSPLNHKRVSKAADRVAVAMPHLGEDARRALVLRSYEHLAELMVEVMLGPRLLSEDGWVDHVELGELRGVIDQLMRDGPLVLVTGHCGNWEIVGYTLALLGFPMHALYRPLDMAPLDRFARRTRERRGLMLMNKFGAVHKLPEAMARGEPVGIVADQNAGDRGLFVPFFNRLASTYKTIGLMAMRFGAPVMVGQARRLAPVPGSGRAQRFRLEVEDIIRPEEWETQPDPLFYLTARYRRGIQRMVERTPEQYLWMHRIWKSRPRHERLDKPFPPALRDKLASLPWMTPGEIDALAERSDRDRAWLREHGAQRLP